MKLSSKDAQDEETYGSALVESAAGMGADWDEAVRLRVEQIRNGTAGPDLLEVMAELDRCAAECEDHLLDEEDEESEDPSAIEAAWADEIADRVKEIREGTVKTYAVEDVLAVLEVRFG